MRLFDLENGEMRYFKYDRAEENNNEEFRRKYAEMTADEKRLHKKGRILNTVGTVLFWVISIACFIGLYLLIELIPVANTFFLWIIEDIILKSFLRLVAIILSAIVGAMFAMPIWNVAYSKHKSVVKSEKRRLLSHSCLILREFYELCEPFVVTKCFESSDRKFNDHDLCIFAVGEELRITTNLDYGFFNPQKDLGCYAFERDEIILEQKQVDDHTAVELRAGEVSFLLGQRAYGFIREFCEG